jgi:hypothetical protein
MTSILQTDMILPEEQADRRGAPRFKVSELYAVLDAGCDVIPVSVINIGKRGFSAQCPLALPTGAIVCLHLDGVLLMPARVIWSSVTHLGARFESPLEEGALLSLILKEPLPHPVRTDRAPDERPYPVLLPSHHHGPQEAAHHP